jgi:alpha-L-arabinofuranosidase
VSFGAHAAMAFCFQPNLSLGPHAHFNQVRYLAIGNEDCHHAYYAANYLEIRMAVKRVYPAIRFIANCDLSKAGALPALAGYNPTPLPADVVDVYDVHFYAPASAFLAARDQYAGCDPTAPKVFLSEYAASCVPPHCTTGTLSNAVAEAAWLVGLERHGDCVELAAYAPLFARREFVSWSPDAVIFNSTHSFGTPSYWVSRLFASHRGVRALSAVVRAENEHVVAVNSDTADGAASESSLAHSVTLDAAGRVIIKLVNIDSTTALPVLVQMDTPVGGLGVAGDVTRHNFASASWEIVSGPSGDAENSMDHPEQVSIHARDISTNLIADGIALTLPPMSVSVVCLVAAHHTTAAS